MKDISKRTYYVVCKGREVGVFSKRGRAEESVEGYDRAEWFPVVGLKEARLALTVGKIEFISMLKKHRKSLALNHHEDYLLCKHKKFINNGGVTIYTDGSFTQAKHIKGNESKSAGGYGALIISKEEFHELSGSMLDTTSARMEMYAIIKAIEYLDKESNIRIYSDCKGIVDILNRGDEGKRDKDLWGRLYSAIEKHTVHIEWVKSHSGINGNEIADDIAGKAMAEARDFQDDILIDEADEYGVIDNLSLDIGP